MAQVLRTHTLVDVHWQDGREGCGAPATAHVPVEHLDDHDFWPDDFVEEKAAVDDLDEPGTVHTACVHHRSNYTIHDSAVVSA